MQELKKIAGLSICYEKEHNAVSICVYEGGELSASDIFYNATPEEACDEFLKREYDICTLHYLHAVAEGPIEWVSRNERLVRTSFGNHLFEKINGVDGYYKHIPGKKLKAYGLDEKNNMFIYTDQEGNAYKQYISGNDKRFYTTCGNSVKGYPLGPLPSYIEVKITEDFAEMPAA